MQAVLLQANGGPLIVGSLPVPTPGAGQVLVRMAAAPINPSDLGFLNGSYGFQKPFPIVPGLEGSGTVVTAGPGLLPHLLLGRRVACSARSGGTWAEYLVTSASTCFPLPKDLSFEQGAMMIVNPMTAFAFFEIAKHDKHAALVNNAAASALGRMILRLGQIYNIPVIHIVRRQEQMELLRSLGGQYLLNSTDTDFHAQLRKLSSQLKATLILDPVAGDQAQRLLDAAPDGSTLLIYGTLSGKRIDPQSLNKGGKRVTGFFLPDWIAKRNMLQVLLDMRRVGQLVSKELQTTIQKRFPLQAVEQAMALSQANPTAGKVLLVPSSEK
ncbi:MAG TPA: zinc-binding dehydrogenase [Anaerolineales bacterium]|nr:zinc-binding dehydrogenase [Anaerolineales bacterium]